MGPPKLQAYDWFFDSRYIRGINNLVLAYKDSYQDCFLVIIDISQTVSRRFELNSGWVVNGRTVQPFGAYTPRGYPQSTSRQRSAGSIWTLTSHHSVIPVVTSLLIAVFSIQELLFTISYFRTCSRYLFYSQACFCYYTFCTPLKTFVTF